MKTLNMICINIRHELHIHLIRVYAIGRMRMPSAMVTRSTLGVHFHEH